MIYQRPGAPVEDRVADLLGRMTLAEKVGQLNQKMFGWRAYQRAPGGGHRLTGAFRDQVARFGGMGALYGLFRADAWSGVDHRTGLTAADSAAVADAVQRWVRDNTRLGIPVLLVEEVPHGHQALDGTVLPTNLSAGASFNPDLYAEASTRAAAELRRRGGHVALVSALDLLRDPRWGRSEECFGEDPYLAAVLTGALVRGMQGDRSPDGRYGADRAAVVLKHFAGQGAVSGGRNSGETQFGHRELHEIHLPAARAGVRAGAAGVMAAYNEIDGVPCTANHDLLTGLLRDRWGFDGVVMADGGATDRLERLTGDRVSAGALALSAGVDLSLWDDAYTMLETAVDKGLVPVAALDRAVARVLRLKFRLGLFERPFVGEGWDPALAAATRSASVALARESITLLRNGSGVLPLGPRVRRIAVLGPNADSVVNQIGDYTSAQRGGTTVLAGIRAAAGPGVAVDHARGCALTGEDTAEVPAAAELARRADVAVLVLGGSSARTEDTVFDDNGAVLVTEDVEGSPPDTTCGEGVDAADLRLGPAQRALVRAVAATGTPLVAVLVQGRPHAVPELAELADGLLVAWYPGPWGGQAVAEVLFGRAEPAGRLPVSVPRSAGQLPVYYNGKDYPYHGYVDEPAEPLFPFGAGLGYTTCEYGAPVLSTAAISRDELAAGGAVEVSVPVANTGGRPAREVVQVYLRRLRTPGWPYWPRTRELRSFRSVTIPPGETLIVTFRLGTEELSAVGPDLTDTVPAGPVEIAVGPSSARLAHGDLTVR
jgi:beta-glucosidase